MNAQHLTAILALGFASAAAAAPGDLDASFNGTGFVADTSHVEPRADGVCLDSAGRIVVAGNRRLGSNSQWQAVLGRFGSTGALDAAFGWRQAGVAAPMPQIPSLLCAGSSYALTSLEFISTANYGVRLDVFPASGASGVSHWLGGQGLISSNPRVALTAPIANRFLVGPTTSGTPGVRTATLQRWDGDGLPALSYQGNWTGPSGGLSQYTDAYTDANGNVFVVGRRVDAATQGVDAMVSSFNASGVLRGSFGSGGTVTLATAADDFGQRIARSAFNGWTYIGITELSATSNPRVRVLRITSAGSVDTNFNGNGVYTADAELGDIIEDNQGRLLVVGNKTGGAAFVRRLLSNGNLDTTFGIGGERVYGFGSISARFGGVTLDAMGRIVLVGHRNSAVRGGVTVAEALIVARLVP